MSPAARTDDPWLPNRQPNPQARWRLFCFGPAGTGAGAFRGWASAQSSLGREVEVCGVQLPGRESRLRERPFERLPPLVAAAADGLARWLDAPFAFFGHGMGARIAFGLARELEARGGARPGHLFVSGARPPHLPARDVELHALGKAELLELLRVSGDVPDEVLAHDELMRLLLPTLRADFAVEETDLAAAEATVAAGMTAIGGELDPAVTGEQLAAWSRHTTGGFAREEIEGADRFYLQSRADDVAERVRRRLAELAP